MQHFLMEASSYNVEAQRQKKQSDYEPLFFKTVWQKPCKRDPGLWKPKPTNPNRTQPEARFRKGKKFPPLNPYIYN